MITPLITPRELRTAMDSERPPLLLDVRWRLVATGDPAAPVGYEDYLQAHLPGAVFVDLATELAGAPSRAAGRHPLPGREAFAASVARWGLADGQEAVMYDDQGGLSAARAWWLLRHAGLPVRVLDGGLAAWMTDGGSIEAGEATPPTPARRADVGWGHLPVLEADAALALAKSPRGALLDARAGQRYRGEEEPIDARPGHLPGALSYPTTENLSADGRFLDVEALTQRFAGLPTSGEGTVGVYCGSGVTAAHTVLALALTGRSAALYPGSYSQYAADPTRPVAVGE